MLKRTQYDEGRRQELQAQLEVPPLPPAITYLWRAFRRLSNRRQFTGFGPARLSWLEIEAFVRMSGLRLAPWEIEMIEALDDLYMSDRSREDDADQG